MFKKIISEIKFIFVPELQNNYRPRFLDSRFLPYYLIFLLLLKFTAVSFLICFSNNVFFADITKNVLISLVNNERQEFNVKPLEENQALDEAAYSKAKDILEKDYFSHNSPEGVTPWYWFQKSGYNYKFAGENLAIGFLDSEEVYNGWIQSPSHRDNLLSPKYNETGLAVVKGEFEGREVTVVVQLFGTLQQSIKSQGTETQKLEPLSEEEPVKEATSGELVAGVEKEAGETGEVKETEKGWLFQFFSFIFSKYFGLTQKIIYISLVLVIFALMVNIFVKFRVQHRDLIFKSAFFLILLILFVVLDKETMIQIIPHSFSIY